MAVNLVGGKIVNTVTFKEDVGSRKRAFASLDRYQKKVDALSGRMKGMGTIAIKLNGMTSAIAQVNKLKRASGIKTATAASDFMGPKAPPVQGSVKLAAIQAKKQRQEAAKLARIYRFEMSPAMQKLEEMERTSIINKLKEQKSANALTRELVKQQSILRSTTAERKRVLAIQNKQNFAQKRMKGSMLQMAGGALSVFTLLRGVGAVARTGMEMQKVSATMLSVSKDSAEAGDNMTFLRKEAHRLGMDRVKAGRAFSKILAARGDLSLGDSKNLFTSVSEAGVVSGTSADEMSLQVKALSQMLGKTSVMSKQPWTFS